MTKKKQTKMNKTNKKTIKKSRTKKQTEQKHLFLDWFKTPELKSKTVKIKENQVVVNAFTKDLVTSVLIMSLLINLYWLSSWIVFQLDPLSRSGIIKLLFMS